MKMTDPRLVFGAKLQQKYGPEMSNEILKIFDIAFAGYVYDHPGTDLVVADNSNWQTLELYLNTKLLEGKSKAGMNNYRLTLRSFLSQIGKPIKDVAPNDIRSFLYVYKEKHGVSDRTLDRYRMQICSFFNWCQDEGIITANPARNIKQIKYVAQHRDALTHMEVERLRAVIRTPLQSALVEALLASGCRISEMLSLKKEDINWLDHSAFVIGKGKKKRQIHFNAKAIVVLQAYLKSRNDSSPWLFVTDISPHNQLQPHSAQAMMKKLRALAGISKPLTPHVLRHTFATFALEADMPIEEVSELLGHSNLDTTRIYAEISQAKLKNDYERKVV